MRWNRANAGTAAILALCVSPTLALASLDGSNSSASAVARFTGDQAGPTVTPFVDHVSLTLAATASETYAPPFGPWQDDFEYEAFVLGSGTIAYGSAAGRFQMEARSIPDFVAPTTSGPPEYNNDLSEVDASMQLEFQEDGTVTGGAPGTPVTLTLNLRIQSEAILVGGHPSFERNVLAQFRGQIIDKSNGSSVERTLYGNGLTSVAFDTAVGHVLSIEGRLALSGRGVAGRSAASFGFFPEFLGSLDASIGGLWLTGPSSVQIDAPSGHDYTIPVPEPGRTLLLLVSAGALLVLRALARRS
jgi:hypothetical protein